MGRKFVFRSTSEEVLACLFWVLARPDDGEMAGKLFDLGGIPMAL